MKSSSQSSRLPQSLSFTLDHYRVLWSFLFQDNYCYDLKLKVSSNKTTLILSNTRELNRVPSTK